MVDSPPPPPSPDIPHPRLPAEGRADAARPGEHHVHVPGIGAGQLIENGPPRVIEIDLGSPAAAVVLVGEGDSARAVVLVDPGCPDGSLTQTRRAAELFETEAGRLPRPGLMRQAMRRPGFTLSAIVLALASTAFAYSDASPDLIDTSVVTRVFDP